MKQGPNGTELDMEDRYGQLSFNEIAMRVKPDIVFAYSDLWTFDHILTSPLRNQFRLAVYYTIDGQPYYGHLEEDGSSSWGKTLSKADELIVLSHFGKDTLQKCCPELKDKKIHVRYHALDMNRFPPINEEHSMRLREAALPRPIYDSAFVCGWLGRNQFRKQNFKLWELQHYMIYGDYIECADCGRITLKEWDHSARVTRDIDGLTLYDEGYNYDYCWHCRSSNISEGVPNENFYMWYHMSKNDPGYNPDLHERMWKITHRSIYTGNIDNMGGISKEDVVNLLRMFDVMYYPSGGEGFGNPAFECMAAGTPVVYSNYSSHAEFCRFGGLPVRVTYQPELHHAIMRASVDTNHAIEQMLKMIRSKELRKLLGESGRSHTLKFTLANMAPAWHKIFMGMMKRELPINSDRLYTTQVS